MHVNVRLDEERLYLLVLIGVRADDRKELITLADGYRESEGSWAEITYWLFFLPIAGPN